MVRSVLHSSSLRFSPRLRFRGSPSAQRLPLDCKSIDTPAVFFLIQSLCQGYTEVRYDEERKRVVYEPLQLTQAFR